CGVFRIEPDRLIVIRDGAVVVTPGAVDEAPVAEGQSVFRIEPDRLAVVCDRAITVALRVTDRSPAVEAIRIARIELDRLIASPAPSARIDQLCNRQNANPYGN